MVTNRAVNINHVLPVITLLLVLTGCSLKRPNAADRRYLSLLEQKIWRDRVDLPAIIVKLPEKDTLSLFDTGTRHTIRRMNFRKSDQIRLLEEYLSFYGNEKISGQRFPHCYGRSVNRYKMAKEDIKFPIEVEALYTLTAHLFYEDVLISPVIIERNTGRYCNFNRRDLDAVYKIYRDWFKRMKRENFEDITWPLKNTSYMWLVEDVVADMETIILSKLF